MPQPSAPQCGFMIPAHQEDGPEEMVEYKPGKFRPEHSTIDVPEQQCPSVGVNLRRSMKEAKLKKGGTHFTITKEEYLCGIHFTPGVIVHLDKSETQHPSMHYLDGRMFKPAN